MDANSSRSAGRKTELIMGGVFVLLALVICFSPPAISARHHRAMTRFPADGYLNAADSELFEVAATITLWHTDSRDPESKLMKGIVSISFNNISETVIKDFRWIGEMSVDLREHRPWGTYWLNDPGVYSSYAVLWNELRRTKYDIYPKGAELPEPEPGSRRWPSAGFIYDHSMGLAFSGADGGLEALVASCRTPIRLKLLHEAGVEYLIVIPEVIYEEN